MADRLTNIEMLLMLSDDVRAQGDDLSAEMHARGAAHARRVNELLAMLEKAKTVLEREKHRFSGYLPKPDDVQQPARISPVRKPEAANG